MNAKPKRSARFKEALDLYSRAAPFRLLPQETLEELAEWTTEVRAPRGQLVAEQAKTQIGKIFFIRKGAIELYYEKDGQKTLGARLVAGEIFGGISVLMNAGVAVRTAKVEDDALFYSIPAERFLELCEKHPPFREHFTQAFQQRKRDESYASILVTGQARDFLSRILPFSFLSEADLDDMVAKLYLIHHNPETVLFVQGQSRIDYLYIIQKGSAELYYEQAGAKSLKGYLGEGDTYGGISMLMNDGVSIRTLRVEEEAYLYALPREHFMRLCKKCPA
ncbi:MAG TPA: cyclic nucleotide-binding domain-containing protein, partial [Desulfosarcina sp.]|nr:cyclic nucleotide-binding domain-containing protein [Desulfosarcina sp.]